MGDVTEDISWQIQLLKKEMLQDRPVVIRGIFTRKIKGLTYNLKIKGSEKGTQDKLEKTSPRESNTESSTRASMPELIASSCSNLSYGPVLEESNQGGYSLDIVLQAVGVILFSPLRSNDTR
ncbi:uncharacterized protein LOC107313496 isoform X2 [Coturnix japonica]|uniref:uncharacterized protein LOC107313496 isoform X2 n=1 Tax=Coturnix japonica TaxID=93934 RepID=UPI000777F27E|nr:uncharacterized protein LOC107313496 isoform X2 [Coturnix japonica]